MNKLLDLLDLVPAWVWALVVGVLLVLCIRLDVLRLQANADASKARSDLLAVQLSSAQAISLEQERARKEERRLSAAVLEVQDALAKEKDDRAGRVAGLSERLQHHARPVLCRPGGGGASTPSGRGDGQPDPGLRSLDGQDLVLVDVQARHELAEFAVSARGVGKTLTEVRGLLRECWKSEAVPVAP
ncbi:hypothetical protein [Aquabacterium parvum]|jgi:hypothetical protein|uniref:hypothetical protein n=1 Tax=Aquabacterium parvum TaxID=70584 RepID=UPI00071903DA|nr:hypothetical protein [Aquabacterium parvum]MBU0916334.1 hypothetical protein [Gammaproteobacteria bacterium]